MLSCIDPPPYAPPFSRIELCKNPYYQIHIKAEVDSFWRMNKNKYIDINDFKYLPFMNKCI